MNVPQEELNSIAETAFRLHNDLRSINDRLRRIKADEELCWAVEASRQRARRLVSQLQRAGADDPELAIVRAERGIEAAEEWESRFRKELPIELLSSEKARKFAAAMRAAAVACREMETERYGPDCDGFAESLEDYADGAEFECYGPKDLRGLE